MLKIAPKLRFDYPGNQIVDGNNFLLCRFQEAQGGLIIRNIAADIGACAVSPIFVFDGANGNERRRKIVPGYKVRTEKEMSGRENLWPTLSLFKSLMPFIPCVVINVPGWESDDVMATLALRDPLPCRIITTDRDISQLAVHPRIEVTSVHPSILPADMRLYKTYVGDPSDKIPGIPNFGPIAWANLNKPLAAQMDFQAHSPEALGMKPSHWAWACANADLLKSYYEIVGLLDVPMSEIVPRIMVGVKAPEKINAILSEFML